jgi:hypothetical protein
MMMMEVAQVWMGVLVVVVVGGGGGGGGGGGMEGAKARGSGRPSSIGGGIGPPKPLITFKAD